jgi:hypothetical protein
MVWFRSNEICMFTFADICDTWLFIAFIEDTMFVFTVEIAACRSAWFTTDVADTDALAATVGQAEFDKVIVAPLNSNTIDPFSDLMNCPQAKFVNAASTRSACMRRIRILKGKSFKTYFIALNCNRLTLRLFLQTQFLFVHDNPYGRLSTVYGGYQS